MYVYSCKRRVHFRFYVSKVCLHDCAGHLFRSVSAEVIDTVRLILDHLSYMQNGNYYNILDKKIMKKVPAQTNHSIYVRQNII